MKKYPSLSLIALCVSLSGCAAGPRHYAQGESRAYEKYVHLVDLAIQHVADDMALNVTKLSNVETPEIDDHPMILWSVESAEHGCGIGQCVVAYNITTPYLWKSPLYIKDGESESYNIAANHLKNYSRFVFRQSGSQDFPIDELYRAVSAALPSWMVIYFPPNHVVKNGQSLPYPVLYEQGEQLLFKEPAL